LADRVSSRGLAAGGLTAMSLGYAVASRVDSLAALYVAYGIGVGLGVGLSYVPAASAVQSWFLRDRAKASGVATAGLGLGTLLLPLTVSRLLPVIGWRGCFLTLAALVCVVGMPATALVRRRAEAAASCRGGGRLLTPAEAWATPGFRRLYLVVLLGSFCVFIPYVHIVPAARDLGLSLNAGTGLIALIGVGNVFGRFILAGLGDRFGAVRLLAVLTGAVACSFAIWAFAGGFLSLGAFCIAFGAAYGGCVGLYPAVAAQLFGATHIGAMLGYLYTSVGIAALIGPTAAGFVFDQTGGYGAPILASAAATTLAAFLTLRLPRHDAGD
jgi:MFS family permease